MEPKGTQSLWRASLQDSHTKISSISSISISPLHSALEREAKAISAQKEIHLAAELEKHHEEDQPEVGQESSKEKKVGKKQEKSFLKIPTLKNLLNWTKGLG